MSIPTGGPYYILLAGRGTGQTATLYHGGAPKVVNTYASTDVKGPYSSLDAARAELGKLTISGQVTVVSAADGTVLGNVTASTGKTSPGAAPAGSSEPSNPAGAIEAEGGNVAPNLPNPFADVSGLVGEAGVLIRAVTDGKMWRSLGWLLLGLVLMLAGIYLWIGKTIPVPPVVPI